MCACSIVCPRVRSFPIFRDYAGEPFDVVDQSARGGGAQRNHRPALGEVIVQNARK